MAEMKPTSDPYRVLGVLRGADPAQIKAAHRRLAKRYHPDASGGDEDRFLAVQEAYQLLSDPVRRREWDRRHAPGPMRASGGSSAVNRSVNASRRCAAPSISMNAPWLSLPTPPARSSSCASRYT